MLAPLACTIQRPTCMVAVGKNELKSGDMLSGRDPRGHMSALGTRARLIASTRRASDRHPRLTMYIKTLTIQGFKSCRFR